MNWFKRWAGALAILATFSLVSHAITIQSYYGTGTNSTTVEHTWDDSGNYTAAGTVTSAGSAVTGNSTVVGNTSLTGNEAVSGLVSNAVVNVSATQLGSGITVSSTTPVTGSYETVLSTANNVLVTATPNISTATVVGGTTALPDGMRLIITSTGCPSGVVSVSSVTYQDNGTLSGSQLHLGATTRTVSCNKVLSLIYNATTKFWTELYYSNNL